MSKKRILFLDIDGVFIPQRAYFMSNQTKPIVKTFDPCVVGMVNKLCHELKMKLVIHSSWLRSAFTNIPGTVKEHMIEQGLKMGHFHVDDSCTYRFSGTRWNAIHDWLNNHQGQVDQWWVLDDEEPCQAERELLNGFPGGRIITTEFDEGLTMNDYMTIRADCGALR